MSRTLLLSLLAGLALLATPAYAAPPHTSLPLIEREVMCVTCKIPLDEAESPQATRERAFIKGLIAEGRGEAQIKKALVGQYGPSVLALPESKGFDAAAYIVPAAVVAALALALALLLPAWRRRAREHRDRPPAQALSDADTARLDADMARFD